jgi:hypothetical protein
MSGAKPTQAQRIRELEKDLAEVSVHLEVFASALLTICERHGTGGWDDAASVLQTSRDGSDKRRAMAWAADIISGRLPDDTPSPRQATAASGARAGCRLSVVK